MMHVLILKGKGKEWGPIYREYLGLFTHGQARFSEVDTEDIAAVNDAMAACEYDGYVFTGSTDDAHDSAAYVLNLIERVQELHARKAKIIGICYGHQVFLLHCSVSCIINITLSYCISLFAFAYAL